MLVGALVASVDWFEWDRFPEPLCPGPVKDDPERPDFCFAAVEGIRCSVE